MSMGESKYTQDVPSKVTLTEHQENRLICDSLTIISKTQVRIISLKYRILIFIIKKKTNH